MLRPRRRVAGSGAGFARVRRRARDGVARPESSKGIRYGIGEGARRRDRGIVRRRRADAGGAGRHRPGAVDANPDQPHRMAARRGRHRDQGRVPARRRSPAGSARPTAVGGAAGLARPARAAAAAPLRRDRRGAGCDAHALRCAGSRCGPGGRHRAIGEPDVASGDVHRRTVDGRSTGSTSSPVRSIRSRDWARRPRSGRCSPARTRTSKRATKIRATTSTSPTTTRC